MKNIRARNLMLPLALLALLAACERQRTPPPPKATASPAAPSTVSLSGAILDPQPAPAVARPAQPGKRPATKPSTAPRPPLIAGGEPDNQALRQFQTEQEQRDRDLLDRDMSESEAIARDQALESERAAMEEDDVLPPDDWDDGRQPYDLPPEDGDWTSADDELPADDEIIDEPPMDDDPPPDDRYYDPRDSGYRP